MISDLFSALDCIQAGTWSFLMWLTPIIAASIFSLSNSWSQTQSKTLISLISTNRETRQKSLLGFPLILFTLILYLLGINFLGLVPFVYGPTRSIWISASLAILFWGSLIISGWVKFPVESAAHFAPAGAPGGLTPLLVLIETVSLLIRPLTLTVRIIANIRSGHIVIGLIATAFAAATTTNVLFVFGAHIGYNIFEVFVCAVQAYVFTLLVKLYGEEHPA